MTTYTEGYADTHHYTGFFPAEWARRLGERVLVNGETWCGWAPGTVAVTRVTMDDSVQPAQWWVTLTHDVFGWGDGAAEADFRTLPIGVCVDGVRIDWTGEGCG